MDHSLKVRNTWSSEVTKKHQLAGKWRECTWGERGSAQAKQGEETNICISVLLHFQTVLISPWQTQELPCPPA